MAGKEVHFDKTYEWALEIGFTEEEAKQIAHANWQIDIIQSDERYERARHLNVNWLGWLFCRGEPSQMRHAEKHLKEAIKKKSLAELGEGLHSVQDLISHGKWPFFGYHWLGPWWGLRKYNPDKDFSVEKMKMMESKTKDYLRRYLEGARE